MRKNPGRSTQVSTIAEFRSLTIEDASIGGVSMVCDGCVGVAVAVVGGGVGVVVVSSTPSKKNDWITHQKRNPVWLLFHDGTVLRSPS